MQTTKQVMVDRKKAQKLFRQGDDQLAAGNLELALGIFRKAASQSFPDYHMSHLLYADVLQKSGRLDEAFHHRMRVLQLNPHHCNSFKRMWDANLSPDQLKIAIRNCRAALNSNQDLALIHTTLGCLLTKQGSIDEAITSFQTAIHAQTLTSKSKFSSSDWNSEGSRGPDFMVVGGMKCGTTSLFSYISQHPSVVPPLIKEIHFFDEHFKNGLAWYRAHFPSIANDSQFITGEATPCLGLPNVWKNVHNTNPNIKLIVLIRDPVERAFSHFHHNIKRMGSKHDFRAAIIDDLKNRKLRDRLLHHEHACYGVNSHYLLLGLYALILKDWLRQFPRDQFLFLKTDDLIEQPQAVMDRVFEFLDISPFQFDRFEKKNRGHYKSHAKLDPRMDKTLRDFYQPFDGTLSELIDIELPWIAKENEARIFSIASFLPKRIRKLAA